MNLKFQNKYVLKAVSVFIILYPIRNIVDGQAVSVAKTEQYIKKVMKTDTVPGIAVAVIKNGSVKYNEYFGYANLEHSIPVSEKSVFQLASVTKQFTAVCIMLLVKQGKINLQNSVAAYLPDAPSSWQKITINNLLTHTSGLKNYENLAGFVEKAYLDSPHLVVVQSILHSLYQEKLNFSPNEKSEYCNSNYFVLGAIIEKVTAEKYEKFLKENILLPLAMDNTVINEMYNIVSGRVSGYTTVNNKMINADRLGMDWFFAEGNIISMLTDMIKWLTAFENHKLLSPLAISKMITRQALNNGSAGEYGYGWRIDKNNPQIIYHSGHTPGFSAFVFHNAARKISIILLMNNDNIKTDMLLKISQDISENY